MTEDSEYIAIYSKNNLIGLLPERIYSNSIGNLDSLKGRNYTIRKIKYEEAHEIKERLMKETLKKA